MGLENLNFNREKEEWEGEFVEQQLGRRISFEMKKNEMINK